MGILFFIKIQAKLLKRPNQIFVLEIYWLNLKPEKMLARSALRLCQANKLAIVPKRGFNGVLYQFSPPKNKVTNAVGI